VKPEPSPTPIRLPRALFDAIVAHSQEGWPNEICGLLAGRLHKPAEVYRIKNIHEQPQTRYYMDPTEQITAFRDLEERGMELYGFYHSHPASPAEPSKTDRAMALQSDWPAGEQAVYPGAIYFIVSLRDRARPELRAWRLLEDVSLEESIAVE
jgi:proteasome lid subunit RPN8/RPN11